MSNDVIDVLPVFGLLIGLIVAFAFDPTAKRASAWGAPSRLNAGCAMRLASRGFYNAR